MDITKFWVMSNVQIADSTTGSMSTEKGDITNFYETDTSKLVGKIFNFVSNSRLQICI